MKTGLCMKMKRYTVHRHEMIPNPKMILHPQNDPQIDPKMICNPERFPKIDPEMMSSTEGIPQLDPEMITQHANGKYLQAQNKQEETEESGNI